MKTKYVVWAMAALAVAAIALVLSRPAAGVVNVDSAKVAELLAKGSVRVVDVRTAGEFAAGHLKGAENVPVDQIASAAASWDKSEPLLVYCASGSRSASAVSELRSFGFKTIYHFSEGLIAWQGDLDTGGGTDVAQAPPVKTSGSPVMYEFFTDW